MDGISAASNALASGTGNENSGVKPKTLGSDDFLKLLTVQLSNQNPMEPMKDLDFIAQMSSFTSLEQMKDLRTGFDDFTKEQKAMTAQNYLGNEATIKTAGGQQVTGIIDSIKMNDDKSVSVRINSTLYDLDDITEIRKSQAG